MNLTTVYRIENPETGVGPFQTRNEFCHKLSLKAAKVRYLRPAPMNDPLLSFGRLPERYVYGAPSIEALKHWFFLGNSREENEKILAELESLGFRLATYLVCDEDVIAALNALHIVFDPSFSLDKGIVEYSALTTLLQTGQQMFCPGAYEVEIFS